MPYHSLLYSYTELELMQEDSEYMQDFGLSQPICQAFETLNEKSEDLTKDLADLIKE